jgi:GDP-L-fucose synthase
LRFAVVVAATVGYKGAIRYDTSQPDGKSHKLLDVSRLVKLGGRAHNFFEDDIRPAYRAYLRQQQCGGVSRCNSGR